MQKKSLKTIIISDFWGQFFGSQLDFETLEIQRVNGYYGRFISADDW